MKKISYLLAVMMALSNAAFAKLGETPQEIEARYGKPKASGTDEYDHLVWRRYSHLDYEITVRFIEGKSACEKLIHRDETQKFPDVECLGLGKAISGETNWNLLDRKGGDGMGLRRHDSAAERADIAWFSAVSGDHRQGLP